MWRRDEGKKVRGVAERFDKQPFAPCGEYPHSTEKIESHVKHNQCCAVESTRFMFQVSYEKVQLLTSDLPCMQHHKHLNRAPTVALAGLLEIRRHAEHAQIRLKCRISLTTDCQHGSSNDICTSHIQPNGLNHGKLFLQLSMLSILQKWAAAAWCSFGAV